MTEIWFAFMWTSIVTFVAILADWVAGQVVYFTTAVTRIRKVIDQEATAEAEHSEIVAVLESLAGQTRARITWGSDLVAVAVSVDFAALGIWLADPDTLTFFQRWNAPGRDVESIVWISLILVHVAVLFVAYILKHLHTSQLDIERSEGGASTWATRVAKNKWMLGSNLLGFATLFSTFVVITDAF